ncbi:Diaminopimelate decarboxylase [subsurface metagenome]
MVGLTFFEAFGNLNQDVKIHLKQAVWNYLREVINMQIGQFSYLDNTLHCGPISIRDIISQDGMGTPTYIYSEQRLLENCRMVRQAFPNAAIRYAVKACMNLSILRLLHQQGFGFDVVSHGELNRAKLAGASGNEIVYAGAAKTNFEIQEAVQSGVTIVVECPEELDVIDRVTKKLRRRVKVLLRLRPNVDAHTHQHLTTGAAFSKFGMPEKTVRAILDDWHRDLVQIFGIHFHIGSLIKESESIAQATRVALPVIDEYDLGELDIGGGFPVSYQADESVPSPAEFAKAVANEIGDCKLKLLIEPGRMIVADTAILVTQVMSKEFGVDEEDEPWRIITCDAGMADLIRPMLYGAIHQVWPVHLRDPIITPTYVAGPYCESTDFLARRVINLPKLSRHDLLAIMHAGAYGRSMASNYNGNLFGAEVLVTVDGEIIVIAHREPFGHSIELEDVRR